MVPAVRPLGPLSMARGCARIDSRPDTAKIGSVDRVEVHHARLLAVIGVRKTFPHGLGQQRTWRPRNSTSALPPKADSSRTSGHVRFVPIVLQKSFWGDERNFLEPLMRFTRGDVRDRID